MVEETNDMGKKVIQGKRAGCVTDIAALAALTGNKMLGVDLNFIRVINGYAGFREAINCRLDW